MSSSIVPHHTLGRNGPRVPALGFGLMGMSYAYGISLNEEEQFAMLDRAVELGATFWDTADLYGGSEKVLGKWFKRTGKRNEIFLATKFGYIKGSPTYATDTSAEYTKKACHASLEALGVDSIDLYYVHSVNPETPIEETMRALAELQAEGKIKYIGLSSVSSATLRRAVNIAPVAAVQTLYSVFTREIEGDAGTNLLATCRELGVALVIACPLGRGVLTSNFTQGKGLGDSTDVRRLVLPHFQDGNREKNIEVVAQFKTFADRKGCTVPQLALAWLLKQGDDIFPIPGTTKLKYLEENWGALQVSLTEEEEKRIRAFAGSVNLSGGTIPDARADRLFRNTKEESS